MNNSDIIIVPADKISYLKNKSKLFNILISTNFSNSNNHFTKNGDYIIKKTSVIPLNNPTRKELIARNKVFEQLRRALMGEYIPNENDAEYIKEFFMFNKNFNFYDPTLEEQPHIERKKMNTTRKNNIHNFNNYGYNYNSSNSNSNNNKKNNNRNINISNDNMNNYNNYVKNLVKKAKKTYSKYPKSGKRPSKYNKYRVTQKLYKD